MTKRLSERNELYAEEKQYSVVKLDTWKVLSDDDVVYKVGEIDSLDADPITMAGRAESVLVLDENGNTVSENSGPNRPTDYTTRE